MTPYYFADVPIGAPFFNVDGVRWQKVDRDHAVRVDDGFRCMWQGDEIVTVLPP